MGFRWLSINGLYNNAAKIFGAEGVLCRRLENLESEMVYITRGKCNVYYASRVSVFFLKKVSSREDCAEEYRFVCNLYLINSI